MRIHFLASAVVKSSDAFAAMTSTEVGAVHVLGKNVYVDLYDTASAGEVSKAKTDAAAFGLTYVADIIGTHCKKG